MLVSNLSSTNPLVEERLKKILREQGLLSQELSRTVKKACKDTCMTELTVDLINAFCDEHKKLIVNECRKILLRAIILGD